MLLHRRRRHLNAPGGRSLLALAAAVLAAHLWLAGTVMPDQWGDGAAAQARSRFQVSFVQALAPAAPPGLAARPAPPVQRLSRLSQLSPVAAAASAASAPAEAPALEAEEPLPAVADAAHAPPLPAVTALAVPDAQATFDWPPSTRLSYRLTGHAGGPVEGQARVEWLRSGSRYQVFLEASVGPAFAPLMSRRESSEGEITPEGLSPRRYEMEMKVLLRNPRRSVIVMEADAVRLPGTPGLPTGETLPRPPGLQDAVSQFVHMTWLFTLRPELLVPGSRIDIPLALPRRIEPWVYEVVGTETLYTEAGTVEAVHVRPRRSARPGDYTAEMWVAPSLQNLPVRIVVRQDAQTYIDLALQRLPEQAERGR